MSVLDDLLDDYGELAEAALRLERSRGNHPGAHELCCENGRCLKCEEARVRAEEDLHEALAKVAPRQFRPGARDKLDSGSDSRAQQEVKNLLSGPAEYLRHFFCELERLKRRSSCDVSHAIGFRDGQLHLLMSIGDFRERVYVQDLDQDPTSAAQDVFLQWKTTPRADEQIE
jgi:hypothetical protein